MLCTYIKHINCTTVLRVSSLMSAVKKQQQMLRAHIQLKTSAPDKTVGLMATIVPQCKQKYLLTE